MSRQGINTGIVPNDGTGDSLLVGSIKINSNFQEIYNTFGDGNNLISYVNTAGFSTVSGSSLGLTGSPNITVGLITAGLFSGDGSSIYNIQVPIQNESVSIGYAKTINFVGSAVTVRNTSGVTTVYVDAATSETDPLFTASPASGITSSLILDWNAAYGWGDHALSGYLTFSSIDILDDGILVGSATSIDFGTNLSVDFSTGIATITSLGGGGGGSGDYAVIAGYSTSSGISTVAQGLTGTPNINVGRVGISSFLTVTGVTTFFNNVHFDYDKYVLIGSNDELQLFHNGANSYIDNSSGNNLVIRTHGGSILLEKEGPENMGVFNTDGSVELYYDNVKKFETVNSGVNISGTLLTNQINSSGVVTATRFESVSAGNPTVGSATTINIETRTVAISTDVTVGRNVRVAGVVTSIGGFISVGNTTPIQITLVGNKLTFTAVGIGSTTLTLF